MLSEIAFRTSPETSLYAKAEELSLNSRRFKLPTNYILKLKACPNNPAYSCASGPPNSKQAYQSHESEFMIFSYSLFALQALGRSKTDDPLVILIQDMLHQMDVE